MVSLRFLTRWDRKEEPFYEARIVFEEDANVYDRRNNACNAKRNRRLVTLHVFSSEALSEERLHPQVRVLRRLRERRGLRALAGFILHAIQNVALQSTSRCVHNLQGKECKCTYLPRDAIQNLPHAVQRQWRLTGSGEKCIAPTGG